MDIMTDRLTLILSILVSIFTWAFIYLIEYSGNAPLVEYQVQIISANNLEKEFSVKIQNLSYKSTFKELRFSIASRAEKAGVFLSGSMTALPPYSGGKNAKSKITNDKAAAQYYIDILHPNGVYELKAKYSGSDEPEFRLLHSDKPIKLTESSVGTFLVKNILIIITVLASLVVTLIGLIIYFNLKKES